MRKTAVGLCALGLATVGLASIPGQQAVSAEASAPNVVLIVVDDARTDDMDTLPRITSRVGEPGATFTGATSSFPLCCPARASLLTGQYPHNHKVLGNVGPQGGFTKFRDADTLATWLDPEYETALIGKYLNEYKAPYVPPGWDYWAQSKATYNYTYKAWTVNGSNRSYPGYQTDTVAGLASDFITANSGPSADPFFLYTSIVAPHSGSPAEPDDPNLPTPNVEPEYRDRFAGRASTDPSFNEADVSDKVLRPAPLTQAEITALTEVNAQRRESLLSGQDAIDEILDTLESTGELDNTYVWFISDNGYILGEHRIRGGKIAPYEVSVRVPMMLRGPGITPGTVVTQPTALVDVAPTILAMTGQTDRQGPYPVDGVNLLPTLDDPALYRSRPIVIEAGPASASAPDTAPYRYHGVIANLDDRQYKYVVREGGKKELYDLTDDPHELLNRAGDYSLSSVQSRMQVLLTDHQWCAGDACR